MASTNRHAIEISSNTRTSSSHRVCGASQRLGCAGGDFRLTTLCFVVPVRVTTLAVLRGPVQLRAVCSRSRSDQPAIVPLTWSRPPSRSPGRAVPQLLRSTVFLAPPGGGSRPVVSAFSLLTRKNITGPARGRQTRRFRSRSRRSSAVSAGQPHYVRVGKALVHRDVTRV